MAKKPKKPKKTLKPLKAPVKKLVRGESLRTAMESTVTDVAVAVVKELNETGETIWNVYILNLKNTAIEGVLVTSTGYGLIQGKGRKTSTLRHFLDTLPAKSFAKIEPIVEDVFGINNEFWVSFFVNKVMQDKKYIFLAESICESNFIKIPLIGKKGVMIK